MCLYALAEQRYWSPLTLGGHPASDGTTTAIVVSEDPGHLMMTAVCDSNCCVDLGRLTLVELPLDDPATGHVTATKAGHYVRYPWAGDPSEAECALIEGPLKLMCVNLPSRKACKDDFQL